MAQETYTPGYSQTSVSFMQRRRAQSHAAFFLPYLNPGMNVLDCGCGPGTISVGLAALIAPGQLTGVDQSETQVEAARSAAAAQGVNARFETASIYSLPFPDNSFDAVFSHAVLEHLTEPVRALTELRRVLKPGGVAGLRSPDWGGFLTWPDAAAALDAYESMQTANGGDTRIGRKLGAFCAAAGFSRVEAGAAYEKYEDPRQIAYYLAEQMDKAGNQAASLWREWCEDKHALFAQAWGETLAWK
jgi:SAM-dependent methyltransferase